MSAPLRALSVVLLLALPLSALACAKGGGGRDGGRRDSGTRRDSGPVRDSGSRDTGLPDTGPACVDDAVPDDCEMASELGTLEVGGMLTTTAKLPTLADEDWYAIDVPSGFAVDAGMPADGGVSDGGVSDAGVPSDAGPGDMPLGPVQQGAGMPRVELVSGDATMVIEIRTRCGAALACGESTARELLEWSFVDDQSMEGAGAYTTRDVPWPERVYIKVSHRGGPASCEDYTLNITR